MKNEKLMKNNRRDKRMKLENSEIYITDNRVYNEDTSMILIKELFKRNFTFRLRHAVNVV